MILLAQKQYNDMDDMEADPEAKIGAFGDISFSISADDVRDALVFDQ